MGNCCATPPAVDGGGGGKQQQEPKQRKGKKPNPFSIEYNRSAPPGASRLVVLREPTGRDIAERYELDGELGRGEFGVTYLCTDRATREALACKSISKKKLRTAVDIEDVRREVEIMRHLPKHPNIVTLRDTYEDDNAVHLVMELCEGGELFDRIVARGHYTERAAAVVTKTIVEVVQMCHKHGVMHRDLKPENFLFANKKETAALKAIDFGLSVFFTPGERFTEIVGSPYYMAPEVLKRNYGQEVDVWSAGVILYILLCGVPPFWAETEQGVAQAIIRSVIDFKRDPWPRVSDNAKDLVRGMLNPDPRRRLTAQQVLDHPWLQNIKKAPNVNLGETVKARLQQFSVMNKFKKHALRVIADHLSVEEVAGIKDMFEKMDLNKDSMINFDELKLGLNKLGHQMPDADVQILMDAVSTNYFSLFRNFCNSLLLDWNSLYWRRTLESKGFRLSRTKTEYMRCGFSTTRHEEEEEVSLDGQVVPQKDTFRYLGSMLQKDGDIDEDVNHRIKAGWMKWRQASGVLCDKRVPQKLKGKFYRTAVRPAMLYGAECWPTKRRHVQQLGVAEMRMLRWMCGHTRKDRVRNDDIRDRVGVAPIEEKLVQHRLRWFGHIQRRPPEASVHSGRLKRVDNVKRGRGRPNLTWEESVKRDLKDWSITRELAMDRAAWKLAIHVPEP